MSWSCPLPPASCPLPALPSPPGVQGSLEDGEKYHGYPGLSFVQPSCPLFFSVLSFCFALRSVQLMNANQKGKRKAPMAVSNQHFQEHSLL